MDDLPLVPHGDAPAHCGDPELVKQKDQPSLFTRGRSSDRISCTSSEQQHLSESSSDLSAVTKNSPLTQPITAVARTRDPDLVIANPAAPPDEMENNIMENPNVTALEKRKVQRLFDRGVPFFTKRDMADLQAQIEAAKNDESAASQNFIFTSVTGRTIERAVMKRLLESRRIGNEKERYVSCSCVIYRNQPCSNLARVSHGYAPTISLFQSTMRTSLYEIASYRTMLCFSFIPKLKLTEKTGSNRAYYTIHIKP